MASIISFTFREAAVDVEYGGKGLKKIEHHRPYDIRFKKRFKHTRFHKQRREY